MESNKIGVVSFTETREGLQGAEIFEAELKQSHLDLVNRLNGAGFEPINPHERLKVEGDKTYGIRTSAEVRECVRRLKGADVSGVVINLPKWTDPHLPIHLATQLDVPTALYTDTDPRSSGTTLLTATAAGLDKVAIGTRYAQNAARLCDKKGLEDMLHWARGVSALKKMRESAILLWGGSYCLKMDVLQDDPIRLKSFMIGDILQEDQLFITKYAERILANQQERIESFYKWLQDNGTNITFKGQEGARPFNEKVFRTQIAFYLAARDRLKELKGENIIGVSIKCQPELSELYGVTACTLPAFLPFSEDGEGKQDIMPTVCEGDIGGLLTASLLHTLSPETPPLFGDLKTVNDKYFVISNCGASSVYYAANSLIPAEALSNTIIQPQCQGESGGAISYQGKALGSVTVARLVRKGNDYMMHLGIGKTLNVDEDIMKTFLWAKQWPHVAVDLGISKDKFMQLAGGNHYCLVPGDHSKAMTYFCKEANLPIVRVDREAK